MQPLILAALLSLDAAPPMPWKLTAKERRFLDGLSSFLVDPRGAERVRVRVMVREDRPTPNPFRPIAQEPVAAGSYWRFKGKDGGRSRVVAADGREVFPRGGIKRIDFVQECRDSLAGAQE